MRTNSIPCLFEPLVPMHSRGILPGDTGGVVQMAREDLWVDLFEPIERGRAEVRGGRLIRQSSSFRALCFPCLG